MNAKSTGVNDLTVSTDMPIRFIKGVGERRSAQFARLGVNTAGDLLRFFPRDYEDWSKVMSIQEAPYHETCCVKGTALSKPVEYRVRKGLTLYKFSVSDGTTIMKVTLFNNKYAAAKIHAGEEYLFFGQVGGDFTHREMSSPMIEPVGDGQRIRPIYPQTEGLNTRFIETAMTRCLEMLDAELDNDPLPLTIRQTHELCTKRFALLNIHFPVDSKSLAIARRRLVFEELFILQLGLLRLKGRSRSSNTTLITKDNTGEFLSLLPFSLTRAQSRTLNECIKDMQGNYPMNRLVQGDVGSGKTAVAAGAAFTVIKNGFQAALMAPTEILAEQHFRSLTSLLEKGGIRVGLLTGSQPAAEKRRTLEALAAGNIDLLVGTHAILSSGVEFNRLGLVVTDEQHRFGVAQRAMLAAKGANPHLLVMSATPIPRTLALIIYGDLDISVLDELPPGRQPIKTYAVRSDKRERAFNYLKTHVDQGRQAYIVCPLVESGEESDLASATEYADILSQGIFKGYSIGLLHGRVKATEKDRVMSSFVKNEISILVSTTVIEVGVDVPNAVIMVIENAERFGLAQLHQLRGRIGRGRHKSTCILISDAQNEEAVRRLKVLCSTNDGFKIADEDLKLRGPGDFFGSRQHGLRDLKIADLMGGDMPLFKTAQDAARELLTADPLLKQPQNHPLAQEISRLFEQVGEHGLN
ncbi:MAG: ATP-dependent DNA helicase RecG [Oscillospiraceae bacterium]|nr:ATP-dependent DNA helicase RecG [Oscillospiraceae bacterium]